MTDPRPAAQILLDTHAWIWRASEPLRLSPAARSAIDRALVIGVSAISPWEIALLVARERIGLNVDTRTWVYEAIRLEKTRLIPLDEEVAIRSVELRSELNKDPADCIIAATALRWGIPVITKDTALRNYSRITTIW